MQTLPKKFSLKVKTNSKRESIAIQNQQHQQLNNEQKDYLIKSALSLNFKNRNKTEQPRMNHQQKQRKYVQFTSYIKNERIRRSIKDIFFEREDHFSMKKKLKNQRLKSEYKRNQSAFSIKDLLNQTYNAEKNRSNFNASIIKQNKIYNYHSNQASQLYPHKLSNNVSTVSSQREKNHLKQLNIKRRYKNLQKKTKIPLIIKYIKSEYNSNIEISNPEMLLVCPKTLTPFIKGNNFINLPHKKWEDNFGKNKTEICNDFDIDLDCRPWTPLKKQFLMQTIQNQDSFT